MNASELYVERPGVRCAGAPPSFLDVSPGDYAGIEGGALAHPQSKALRAAVDPSFEYQFPTDRRTEEDLNR